MELVEKHPYYYLGRKKITLNDTNFEIEFSSLIGKRKVTYKYEDVKPDFEYGTIGEVGWGDYLAFPVVCVGLATYLSFVIASCIAENKGLKLIGAAVMLFLFFVAFCLFLVRFIKCKCVYIYEKNNEGLTVIKMTNKAKDFIEEFQKRVESVSNGNVK